MLVLALDTTTRWGSCAAVRDGQVIREQTSDPDREHATHLPADLMMLLAHTDLRLREVDAFAVAIGPGSFTGLRIGIASMQGLAFALKRPLIGVSALDALASIAGSGRVATWVDAWRGEVYASTYQDGTTDGDPVVASPASLISLVTSPTTFIGEGVETYRAFIDAELGPLARFHEPVRPPLAGRIGVRATAMLASGECPGPDMIRPIYVRRPDAELAREARRGS